MHDHLPVDAVLQGGDMGDDAHQSVAFGQAGKHPDGLLQRFLIQRAEALIEEEGVQPDAAGVLWTSSERPRASASEALKLSPPDRVLTLRRVPL